MLAAAVLAGVALLAFASRLAATRAAAPPLPEPDPARPAPSTLAVLPVRDEEANVAGCVQSLLAQSAPLRIRVVDDGSRDATAARAAELVGNAGGRLELLAAGPLPPGWVGKVHALGRGCAGTDSEWLLFTDADTRHRPELLARAHAAAAGGLDLVSVAGLQRAPGWGAGLLTPAVFALLDADLGDWEPHARGEGEPPLANGQFLLVRRAALEAAGGLAALAGAPEIDDVALARRIVGSGGRVGFFRALDLLEVEMYRGLPAAWRGWRRNLALLYGDRPGLLSGAAAAAALPGALLAALLATGALPAALLLWVLAAIASAAMRLSARFPVAPALLTPLDGLLFAALLLTALADHRRGRLAPWRGRELPASGSGGGGREDSGRDQDGSGAA